MKKIAIQNKKYVIFLFSILLFTLFATVGFSFVRFDRNSTNISTTQASAQEPSDINSDGVVDIFDLSILLSNWNTSNSLSDLNSDGVVNIFDLSLLLSKWGTIVVAPTKPDATNTGVPSGVTPQAIATKYPDATGQGYTVNAQGRVTITKDGGVYDGVLFPAGVVIRAKNITIRNSRITGGRSSFSSLLAEATSWQDCRDKRIALENASQNPPSLFLVDANYSTVSNFIMEDSEITITENSQYINNYMGHDTTMRRLNISGGVDAIGTHNGYSSVVNFRLESSYIHDLYWAKWSVGNYNTDPNTGTKVYCGYDATHNEATHNDGIQMHDGSGVYITGNYINAKPLNHEQSNATIMMNNATDIHVTGNHLQYGLCSINMVTGLGLPVDVSNNTFYGNNGWTGTGGQGDGNCAIIRPASAGYNFSNNLWQSGSAITLTNG